MASMLRSTGGKAKKKGKMARLGSSVQIFEGSSLAGNHDSEIQGGGELEIGGWKRLFRAAYDAAQRWTGRDFPICKPCCCRIWRVIDMLPDCPEFGR
jgi:hypothetical protein